MIKFNEIETNEAHSIIFIFILPTFFLNFRIKHVKVFQTVSPVSVPNPNSVKNIVKHTYQFHLHIILTFLFKDYVSVRLGVLKS